MGRCLAILVTALALAGCNLGGESEPAAESVGNLSWSVGLRIADRTDFPLSLPARRYRLMTAGRAGDVVTFELLTPRGRLVSLEQSGDRSAGLERSLTRGAIALGVERIAGTEWRFFRQPTLSGLLLLRSDPQGAVVALHGDTTRAEFRDLAASLGPRA